MGEKRRDSILKIALHQPFILCANGNMIHQHYIKLWNDALIIDWSIHNRKSKNPDRFLSFCFRLTYIVPRQGSTKALLSLPSPFVFCATRWRRADERREAGKRSGSLTKRDHSRAQGHKWELDPAICAVGVVIHQMKLLFKQSCHWGSRGLPSNSGDMWCFEELKSSVNDRNYGCPTMDLFKTWKKKIMFWFYYVLTHCTHGLLHSSKCIVYVYCPGHVCGRD